MAKFLFEGVITPIGEASGGCGCVAAILLGAFAITTTMYMAKEGKRRFDYYIMSDNACVPKHDTESSPWRIGLKQCESTTIILNRPGSVMTAKAYGEIIPMGRDIDDRLPVIVAGDSWTNYTVYAHDQDTSNSGDEYLPMYDIIRSKDGATYEITSNQTGQNKVKIKWVGLEFRYEN